MGLFKKLFSNNFENKNDIKEKTVQRDIATEMVNLLGFDSEIFKNEIDDKKIIKRFNELKVIGKKQGFTPVMIVVSDTLLEALEFNVEDMQQKNETIEDIKLKANSINGKDFLLKQKDDKEKFGIEDDEEFLSDDLIGEYIEASPIDDFINFTINKKGFIDDIIITNIPTQNSWEIPLYIQMGGYNDCPNPEEQSAVCKYWYEKYGAEISVISCCEIEFYLDKPISDEESYELAEEHFLFCYDRVYQCSQECTIKGLASVLKDSSVWYFWWD